ncbi:hypothetical protein COCNU_scaffold004829G000020 [Cocos nucifera]|nr:hypothetical protein [Cocos nucifera]
MHSFSSSPIVPHFSIYAPISSKRRLLILIINVGLNDLSIDVEKVEGSGCSGMAAKGEEELLHELEDGSVVLNSWEGHSGIGGASSVTKSSKKKGRGNQVEATPTYSVVTPMHLRDKNASKRSTMKKYFIDFKVAKQKATEKREKVECIAAKPPPYHSMRRLYRMMRCRFKLSSKRVYMISDS